jgi:exodeoxyribonuclease VII large subunit
VRLAPDIGAARQRTADLVDRGARALGDRVERRRLALAASLDGLRALSPTATLERGYAVARTADGQVIVARGTVETRVERTRADGTEELLA